MAEATKLKGVVMTSSPSPISSARTPRWSPAVPLEQAIPFLAASEGRDARLEPRPERAHREHVAAQDLGHELELPRPDVGPGKREARSDGP